MRLTAILFVGALSLTPPAFAQGAVDAGTSPQTAAQSADVSTAMQSQPAATSGIASSVSSVPNTEKKYVRTSRNSDFQKEAETTKQLNQQMANANGIPKTLQ